MGSVQSFSFSDTVELYALVLLTGQSCKCQLADRSVVYILANSRWAFRAQQRTWDEMWGPLQGFSSDSKKKGTKSRCFLLLMLLLPSFRLEGTTVSKTHSGLLSMGICAGSWSLFCLFQLALLLAEPKAFLSLWSSFCNNLLPNSYLGEKHGPVHYHLYDMLSLPMSVPAYSDDLFLKFCHQLSVSCLDDSAEHIISSLPSVIEIKAFN